MSLPCVFYISMFWFGFLMSRCENVLENIGMPVVENITHNPIIVVR